MKTLLNSLVLLALTSSLFFSACAGERIESDDPKNLLDGWIKVYKRQESSKFRTCANLTDAWKLEIVGKSLKAEKYSEKEFSREPIKKVPEKIRSHISENKNIRGKQFESAGFETHQHFERYENGWLIGTNVGEWGGELFWLRDDLEQKIDILRENIQGIVKIDNKIFILTGLQHGEDQGAVWKLFKDEKGILKARLVKDLGTQPKHFWVENKSSFLVFFDNSIRRVNTTGEIEFIQKTNFYPSSIVRSQNGEFYIGMSLYVVRLIPEKSKFKVEWYIPKGCQEISIKGSVLILCCLEFNIFLRAGSTFAN